MSREAARPWYGDAVPAELRDLPGGRVRATAAGHWRLFSLPVVYDKPATAFLGALDLPVANERTGELAAQVWLLPRFEAPLVDVMIGEVSIGASRLEHRSWEELRLLEEQNTFADGVVFCWPIADGVVEPDSLKCVLPSRDWNER